ncbi:hypothetical protein BGX24_005737 [Mortierella sp. AD032]|nr:hypothetical protein BGX24_005737 [Mortierella sp. AD032]
MSVRLAHAAAIEAAQEQAKVQARAAQADAVSSSSLWSLAEKSPTSSSALTPDRRCKILRTSAFVLCPLPRVCILLGLIALTLLASLLQGYRIRKGTHCSLYEEPLRGFCRSTKSAAGAVFLESVLWLCWFAFWFFVSFHKTPGSDEMEVDGDGSSVVRMGLSQHSASFSSGGGERSRGSDSDLELGRMPTVPVQWDQAGSNYSPVTPSPAPVAEWHDSRQGDLDEHCQQKSRPIPPPEKELQESRSMAPSTSSSSFTSCLSSTSSLLHPDGRTMQRQQERRLPSPSTPQVAGAAGTVAYSTPSSRARKMHPPVPPRINTAALVQKGAVKFEGPRTRGSNHTGPPSSSSVSSFSVRILDTDSGNNRNSIIVPAMAVRQTNHMSRSYSADISLDQGQNSATFPSSSAINSTSPATATVRPRSVSLGTSGTKAAASAAAACLLRPPPCPLPSANNNNNSNNGTAGINHHKDVGGRLRPSSSEFVLLTTEEQQKVDLYWGGQLPYPPPPPLSPSSSSVGTFFPDLEDSEKEKALRGTRLSFQSKHPQVRSSTQ